MKAQLHIKGRKQGKQEDISHLRTQLDALGLKIIQVTADGNCFFRALADQLEGNEDEHGKYRSMVVQYIVNNRETFEPFIEDDVSFDEYCRNMGKDYTWAGHMELQAASLVTRSNICIHRNMSPRWYIKNFDKPGARMVHLSYHDGEHYNSVRIKEDTCSGPARPIIIEADADLPPSSDQAKAAVTKSNGASDDNINQGSIELVMAESCCESAEKVEQVSLQVDSVDAAIEFLVAERGTQKDNVENDFSVGHIDTYVDSVNASCEKLEEEPVKEKRKEEPSSNNVKRPQESETEDKKISRNMVCPCGSNKKYKACCGSVSGKSSAKFLIKGRKERKQSKRGASTKSTASSNYDGGGGPPDMGALCI